MLAASTARKEQARKRRRSRFSTSRPHDAALRKLETCGKPWVSAINGTCMGGAFELSLACHGRVAADGDKVKMGLPEVKVGLFPGAGGTQRVPRLCRPQDALQMLLQGEQICAAEGQGDGPDPRDRRARRAGRDRQGDDQAGG